MEKGIKKLPIERLEDEYLRKIAEELQAKIHKGLSKDKEEILCLPTYIDPYSENSRDFVGKILVIDWGGTNLRVAIIEFNEGEEPKVLGEKVIGEEKEKPLEKRLSEKETKKFTCPADLYESMAELIVQLKDLRDNDVMQIGYCFSYPAESTLDGDAILERWTKGIDIPDMIGKPVGKPLMEYLNGYESIKAKGIKFTGIKVINDTVACLIASLKKESGCGQIGLIAGTGNNMAAVIKKSKINKLSNKKYNNKSGCIPVNLESGNLKPYTGGLTGEVYLTEIDKKFDLSLPKEEQQTQLFEKAMAGKYIGKLYKLSFKKDDFDYDCDFDGEDLTNLMNPPQKRIKVAREIYERSAQLVAASLVGLTLVLVSKEEIEEPINKICVAADGSLYWSNQDNEDSYNAKVKKYFKSCLADCGLNRHIELNVRKDENANLIGAAIAALS